MSEFTYEKKDTESRLENCEWDNVWWEKAGKDDLFRVLYIGDSISCGIRRAAAEIADKSMVFDVLGTSKAVDNPYLCQKISLFAAQQRGRGAVLFNNGLHGWHLSDEDGYAAHYEGLVRFLLQSFPETPIFLVLTSAVANEERGLRVAARNRAVLRLAEKYALPVIDLYSITDLHRDLLLPDGVHLTPEGYKLLARAVIDAIEKTKDKTI